MKLSPRRLPKERRRRSRRPLPQKRLWPKWRPQRRPGLAEFDYAILFVLGTVAIQSWNPINRKLLSRSDHPDTIALWKAIVEIPTAGEIGRAAGRERECKYV